MSCSQCSSPLRAALYIRVSTRSQEELSPDSQKRLLLDYACSRNILVAPEHIYMEKGISGRRADRRPRFQQMIAAAKSPLHPFDLILVWKFSRFARNQEESIVYKSMLKKLCSVDVVSISEPLEEGPFGSLIERIIEWMDEFYSIRLSGDVFRGMTEKALRGGYQCRPPLGYRIPGPGLPPEIVPEEAGIVKMIFQAYGEDHMGLGELCRRLNALGFRTAKGNLFEKRSVKYILQNPLYAGIIRWNRTDGNSRTKPREQWILKEGSHPPIVPLSLFCEVEQRLEQESRHSRSEPSPAARHWLSGLAVCPSCGRSLAVCTRRRKTLPDTVLLQCSGYLKGSCSCSCYLTEDAAVHALHASLEEIFSKVPPSFLPCYRLCPDSPSQDPSLQPSLVAALRRAKAGLQRASSAYLNGIDSEREYLENKTRLTGEIELLLHQLEPDSRSFSKSDNEKNTGSAQPCSPLEVFFSCSSVSQKNRALRSVILQMTFFRKENRLAIVYRSIPDPSTGLQSG